MRVVMENSTEIPEPNEIPDKPDEYPSDPQPLEPNYPDTPEPEPLNTPEPENE